MKIKHNKKRNTAFLFEALVRELTKTVVSGDSQRGTSIKNILREHFSRGMVLFSELDCFNSVTDMRGVDQYTAEKTLHRARHAHQSLDKDEVFKEQSQVIRKINTDLGKEVYNTFVPNYKSFATLSQIFGEKAPLKNRMLMEKKIMEDLMAPSEDSQKQKMEPIDTLVVSKFTKSYNDKYKHLLPEQQSLLSGFITSFTDENIDFRISVGRELRRIYESVQASLLSPEVLDDPQMIKNTKKVLERLSKFSVSSIGETEILEILKLQNLVNEYEADASNL
jgi:hypothetical protein